MKRIVTVLFLLAFVLNPLSFGSSKLSGLEEPGHWVESSFGGRTFSVKITEKMVRGLMHEDSHSRDGARTPKTTAAAQEDSPDCIWDESARSERDLHRPNLEDMQSSSKKLFAEFVHEEEHEQKMINLSELDSSFSDAALSEYAKPSKQNEYEKTKTLIELSIMTALDKLQEIGVSSEQRFLYFKSIDNSTLNNNYDLSLEILGSASDFLNLKLATFTLNNLSAEESLKQATMSTSVEDDSTHVNHKGKVKRMKKNPILNVLKLLENQTSKMDLETLMLQLACDEVATDGSLLDEDALLCLLEDSISEDKRFLSQYANGDFEKLSDLFIDRIVSSEAGSLVFKTIIRNSNKFEEDLIDAMLVGYDLEFNTSQKFIIPSESLTSNTVVIYPARLRFSGKYIEEAVIEIVFEIKLDFSVTNISELFKQIDFSGRILSLKN